ncbi:hypothetical protein IJG29_03015 [Candidatus Saccharibacteria bacterium]|nr:hypothetical protein [Candidatus Saccharibacteria bacterium]
MKNFIASLTAIVLSFFAATSPVMAAGDTAATNSGESAIILKDCAKADNGHGEGIICIIQLVINILTIGIGVVAVIGITIAGIQYITAGGNEEQTRKAKRRIFEIVIGLAAYAVIYLILYFLLPNFAGTNVPTGN